MKTAVIYARYSCDKQTEQSIDGQLRVCQDYAKSHDIMIIDTYIDEAISGTTDNRPDFQRMIKDSAKKSFEFVLVYKLDRFSRDKFAATMYKHTLKQNGVKVLSAMENIPDTPEGIILESLLEGMNQYYSAELAQKVSRGMKETRRKGLYQGGAVLYGYKIDGRKIVIDEPAAEVVRYMYKQYANGVFVRDIIKDLTDKGILYKGKPFVKNSVYNILRNEKYSGVYKHGDEVIDNMYPQIVPTDIYERVRAKVTNNKYGKKSVKIDFLLRQKLICGNCGQPMHGESGTTRNGTKIYYYKCNGRKKRINDCNKGMIRKEVIEDLVIKTAVEELSNPEVMSYIVNELLRIQEMQLKENSALKVLTKQQKQVETAINNIVANMERGIVSNATNKRLKELESQQELLERQILIERSKQAVQFKESDIREFYEQMLHEPKTLITYLIKQVILYDDKIEIQFNSPIRISPDDESCRGFSFYSETIELITFKWANTKPYTQKTQIECYI